MRAKLKTALGLSKCGAMAFGEVCNPRKTMPDHLISCHFLGLHCSRPGKQPFLQFLFNGLFLWPVARFSTQLKNMLPKYCNARFLMNTGAFLQGACKYASRLPKRACLLLGWFSYCRANCETALYCLTHDANLDNLQDYGGRDRLSSAGFIAFPWQVTSSAHTRLVIGLAEDRALLTHEKRIKKFFPPEQGNLSGFGFSFGGALKANIVRAVS